MKQIYRLSEDGFLIGSEVLSPTEVDGELRYITPGGFADTSPSPYFLRPRYVDGQWIEAATEEEKDEQDYEKDQYTIIELLYQEVTQIKLDQIASSQSQTSIQLEQIKQRQAIDDILIKINNDESEGEEIE